MSETMTINEKILGALKSATTYLEISTSALSRKDDDSFADSLWHVGAELEYALFLFSITSQNENLTSKLKLLSESKKDEIVSTLVDLRNLLEEAKRFVLNEKLVDAYKNVHVARQYLLKIKGDLAKKKREIVKKK